MKIPIAAVAMAVALTMPLVAPAHAQVVIQEGQGSDFYSDPDDNQTETDFLRRWNRHHDQRNKWGSGWGNFGPDDAVRLLERRGYRVRDVTDVGERFLIRAWRDGDDLLVSVSRRGEIMGVVHDRE
ncbi:hypothetical protein ATY78_27455 [Rhizobium sp. R635]|uniref:hypothetical protein n=1 Tax=Rhizobium sp. R635 TaxID=1764275 RepID=UPI000B52F78B|nr:hypothetical protein [Rhizobium sp. R635]OWV81279.1 hypothetical protein ATY78_27455 [Rhizobium sp. R635]